MVRRDILIASAVVCVCGASLARGASLSLLFTTTFTAPDGNPVFSGGINDNGVVTFHTNGSHFGNSYIRQANGVFTQVSFPGAMGTVATGINSSGEVVGYYYPQVNNDGFIRNPDGTFIDLAPFSVTAANAVNNSGTVVGNSFSAFIRDSAGNLTYFSYPGSFLTLPMGINDLGQIAGLYCSTSACDDDLGFIRNADGTFIALNMPSPVNVFAIDNSGNVLGRSSSGLFFLRHPDGTVDSLFVPGGTDVLAMNNNGQFFGVTGPGQGYIGVVASPPSISSLSPSSVTAGGPAFTLTLNGAGFVAGSTAQWNGTSLPTSYLSGNQLSASVAAHLIAFQETASITVANPGGAASNAVTFTIVPTTPIVITTPYTLPSGTADTFYSQTLSASGGVPPYNWSIISGALASGLTLSSAGTISGTPSGSGTFLVAVRVTDSALSSEAQNFSLTVSSGLMITTASPLAPGTIGAVYSSTLGASGGRPPYTWSLVSGAPPSGLTLSNSGAITGTPSTMGTSNFTVQVTDSASSTARQALSLTIAAPSLSFTTALRVAQIADGASWKTLFAIVNLDPSPVNYLFQFWDDNGNPLQLPFVNGSPGALLGTLAAGGTVFAETPGTSPTLLQGWAEVASTGRVGVLTIFRQSISGRSDSEGTVSGTLSGDRIFLPFDNTQGQVTSVAVANTNSKQALIISLFFHLDNGAQITASLTLAPHAHMAFPLPTMFRAVAGARGSVELSAASPDITVLGLRFSPANSFTSVGAFQ